MKLNQENVYRLLKEVANKGATTKEILTALGQRKRQRAQLRKILKELNKAKISHKLNNRYYLNEIDEPESVPRTRKKSLPVPNRIKQKRHHRLLGQVFYQGMDQVVYVYDLKEQFSVIHGEENRLLHGDLVAVSLVNDKSGEKKVSITELIERRITVLKGKLHKEKKGRVLFFPETKYGLKQFFVSNSVEIKKDQVSDAWLDIATTAFHNRKLEGIARLIPEGWPENSAILENILSANHIPEKFPPSVLDACQSLPKVVRMTKNSHREDLRNLKFVTIDGEDAKDFDDAVYAEKEGEHFRIWVSIADVASYVKAGSVVDREAFCRGTSTYLPGTVYPMLPEVLSNGLCSLKEGLNRKTLTCECLLDKTGKTVSSRIYSSMSRINLRLTYTEVDQFFQTGKINTHRNHADLAEFLTLCREIATILRKRRIKAGFINFQLPETGFSYDKNNRITAIKKTYQSEGMQVIEQLMLLANETVAKFCHKNRLPIVWRNHSQPLPEKLKKLQRLLWNNHVKAKSLATGKEFNQVMKQIKTNPQKDFLEYAMLRSMSLAVYETHREGHFGIASEYYCHFTSPIRRYPDLLVHRALKNHLASRKPFTIPDYVAATASERERMATAAERSAVKFHKLCFMAKYLGEFFDAKIAGFIHSGVFVEIDHPYVEGFVPFATIHDDHYEFDEDTQCIRGERNKTQFTIGKKLSVILTRLDWANLSPEFDWICWKEDV